MGNSGNRHWINPEGYHTTNLLHSIFPIWQAAYKALTNYSKTIFTPIHIAAIAKRLEQNFQKLPSRSRTKWRLFPLLFFFYLLESRPWLDKCS